MALDWYSGPLADGLRCYRRAHFFEAHEHWELVWLQLRGPEKSFLQAIIQITAAMHHFRSGNTVGAASLLRRSHRSLTVFSEDAAGIAAATLRGDISAWLLAMESGTPPPTAVPRITELPSRRQTPYAGDELAMPIRLATLADIPAILALIRSVVPLMRAAGNHQWDEHYPNQAVFTADIAHGHLWVAELTDQIAGVAAITTEQEPEYAQVGWDTAEPALVIHRLAVDPAFHGRGVGIALMQQAEALALQRGIAVLRVDTNTSNKVTQRLMPKLGYTLSGEIGLSYRPGLRFLCYEKRLATLAAQPPSS